MSASAANSYFLPPPSRWPIIGACSLLLTTLGAAMWVNRGPAGPYVLAAGALLLVWMLFGWFGSVIRESEKGLYNRQVDVSYRWAMGRALGGPLGRAWREPWCRCAPWASP